MPSIPIAVVTGANRGLGLETSRQLARRGIKVLMGARDETSGKSSAMTLKDEGLDVVFIPLDVTNTKQIRQVKKYIEDHFGILDILVNNAGIMSPEEALFGNSAETISQKILRQTFDVNFFGVVELTQALLPLIKRSKAGRIVNLSSVLGSLHYQSDESNKLKPLAYNASKTAVNQFTIHLASALKDTPIKVNSGHPGWVRTNIGGPKAPLDVPEGARTAVRLATLGPDGPTGKFFYLDEELPW
ncbi:MAG: SDR family oxidoreductase [Pseudomonadota bacterium]